MHEDVDDVYDEVEASKFNAAVGGGSAKSAGINQSRILMSLDGFDKANKLLDYGCGIGRTMPALSTLIRKDVRIDGCDISSDFIAECRRLYRNYGFTFYKIASRNEHYDKFGTFDISEDIPSNFYDYAYSFSVFTHLSLSMVSEALKGV